MTLRNFYMWMLWLLCWIVCHYYGRCFRAWIRKVLTCMNSLNSHKTRESPPTVQFNHGRRYFLVLSAFNSYTELHPNKLFRWCCYDIMPSSTRSPTVTDSRSSFWTPSRPDTTVSTMFICAGVVLLALSVVYQFLRALVIELA
jgi:hypothetical protein